jgi:hypothetical protein
MASEPGLDPLDAAAAAAPPPPPPAASTRALSCPGCGGSLELRAAGYTVTIACRYCGSILDVANADVRLITKYEEAQQALEIPLGTRGTLYGIEWEVIGYLRRSERGSYGWEEYLLFNPYHGYRWLVTNGRGWSFAEMLTRAPDWYGFGPHIDGNGYEAFFSNGQAQVDYVLGEFYWRVQVGEEVATDDYVRPGWMLSREANQTEISWSLSRLVDPRTMESAFGVQAPLDPWPPLPHQPSPWLRPLKIGAVIAAASAAIILLFAAILGRGTTLLQANIPYALNGQEQSTTIGPVVVTRPYQLVAIRANAPFDLDNAWVDIDYSLVNRETQESYDAYGLAEHYSGSDSDGPWQEGDRGGTVKIASVPSGTYDLVIDTKGNNWSASSQSGFDDYAVRGGGGQLSIEVSDGSVFPSNLLLALVLLLLPLGYLWYRHISFEKARKAERSTGSGAGEADDDEEEDNTTIMDLLDL